MLKIITYNNKNYYCVDKELRGQLTAEEKKDLKDIVVRLPFSAKNFVTVEDYEELIDTEELIEEEEEVEAEELEDTIEVNTEAEEVERIYIEHVDINDSQEFDIMMMYASDEFQAFKEECKQYTDVEDLELDLATKGYKIFNVLGYKDKYCSEGTDITVVLYDNEVRFEIEKQIKNILENRGIYIDRALFVRAEEYGICCIEKEFIDDKIRMGYGWGLDRELRRITRSMRIKEIEIARKGA